MTFRERSSNTAFVLTSKAERNLPRTPITMAVLQWSRDRADAFGVRLEEFETARQTFNQLLSLPTPDIDAQYYKNLLFLKGLVGSDEFLSWDLIISACGQEDEKGYLHKTETETFALMRQKIISGEWDFTTGYFTPSPSIVATRLLVQGYGIFIEKFLEEPGIGTTVSLALAEVLLMDHRNTMLFTNLLPWMQEQKHNFSPDFQTRLEKISQAY